MQVHEGELISITGPSGSGKTSLMMLIAGVEKPTSGSITVAGEEISSYDEDALASFRRRHVGVVFQNFHLIPNMTAKENVEIALELAGHDDASDKANDGLKSVGLEHRIGHYPYQLSGGEQQTVALARALATKPSLLLADEPTGNLDSENGKHITELLFELTEKNGTTVVLITHDMQLADQASKKFLIKDGKIYDNA
ncbi:MAG: ABC transporter ATP-binding protein [Rickettsiales bacterium]|nr:ABC transporter ATP-binding protein [Rickettsiales bacterium]